MPTYTQSKITEKGAMSSKYEFNEANMEAAIKRVKETIPTLRSFYNAVAITLTSSDPNEEIVMLKKGEDF